MLTYIGGMQMTPGAMYAPSRTVDPPGTMRTPAREARLLQRQRVLVVERPAAVIHRHVDDVAEPEAEQDALLHPGVDAPADRARRIGLGGADRAGRQRLAQLRRTPSRAAVAIGRRAGGDQVGDVGLEHALTRTLPARLQQVELLQHLEDLAPATRAAADTSAAGRLSSSRPIAAIAALTGTGIRLRRS